MMGFSSWRDRVDFSTLKGRTLTSAVQHDDDRIIFTCDDGAEFSLHHEQDCCEGVYIDDVNGDLQSLVGSPLLVAEEVSDTTDPGPRDEYTESYTWTFYKLATINGHVDIRWYGESNGYYSESVDLYWINRPPTGDTK